jgi:hypothetical protein
MGQWIANRTFNRTHARCMYAYAGRCGTVLGFGTGITNCQLAIGDSLRIGYLTREMIVSHLPGQREREKSIVEEYGGGHTILLRDKTNPVRVIAGREFVVYVRSFLPEPSQFDNRSTPAFQ